MKLQNFLTNYIDTVPAVVLVASVLLFFHLAPPLLKMLGPGQNAPLIYLAFEIPLGFILIVFLLCAIFTVNSFLFKLLTTVFVFLKNIFSLR